MTKQHAPTRLPSEPPPIPADALAGSAPGAETRQLPRFALIPRMPGSVINLHPGINRFGRHRRNHHVLRDPHISRHHCEINIEGETISIRDLGSSGGTFVNGQRIFAARIAPGDEIWLSPVVRFSLGLADMRRIDEARITARTPLDGEKTSLEKGRALQIRSLLNRPTPAAGRAVPANTIERLDSLCRVGLDCLRAPEPRRIERRLLQAAAQLVSARRVLLFYHRGSDRWRFGAVPRRSIEELAAREIASVGLRIPHATVIQEPRLLDALALLDEDLVVAPLVDRGRRFGVLAVVVDDLLPQQVETLDRLAEIAGAALAGIPLRPKAVPTADYVERTRRTAAAGALPQVS
jgi:hypothetical protein